MAIIDMKVKGPKANHTVEHPIRNQPKCNNWWSFMIRWVSVYGALTEKMIFISFLDMHTWSTWRCNNVTYQVAVSFSSESLHPNIYTQIL